LLDENLDFAFGSIEFLLAGGGQADTFLKEFDGLFERKVSALQLINDLL